MSRFASGAGGPPEQVDGRLDRAGSTPSRRLAPYDRPHYSERRGDAPLVARVAERAAPGEVLVSSTVKDLVEGSGLSFADRGSVELAGIPGEWRLYAAVGEAVPAHA